MVNEGSDLTIIAYVVAVHWAIATMGAFSAYTADILDLRTLMPLDYDAIKESVKKTGKVVIVHEDTLIGGIGAEISAFINENCFEYLDGPVLRCASLDTPVPFAIQLENNFLPKRRLQNAIEGLLNY